MKRVYAMSYGRADLASWIEEHTFPVVVAITQLYMFPYSQYRSHWVKEVYASFNSMKLLKHNNKLPSARFIYDNSWGINKRFYKDAIVFVKDKESELQLRDDFNELELVNILDSYFEWLAAQLSQHRVITLSQVFNELKQYNI